MAGHHIPYAAQTLAMGNYKDLYEKAKLGIVDIIITNLPSKTPSELNVLKLMDLHDCFVVSNKFKDIKNTDVSLEEFTKLPLLVLTKGENITLADLIDAATAERFGMVNHVCEDEVLKDEVYKMASRLAKSAPLSIGLTKKYLNDTDLTMDEVLAIEETTQPLLMGTDDCKEGIAAFYEKREAVFTGK